MPPLHSSSQSPSNFSPSGTRPLRRATAQGSIRAPATTHASHPPSCTLPRRGPADILAQSDSSGPSARNRLSRPRPAHLVATRNRSPPAAQRALATPSLSAQLSGSSRRASSCDPLAPSDLLPIQSPSRVPRPRPASSLPASTAMSPMLDLTNYLAAKLKISYDNNGQVDMLGSTMTGSKYSLTGLISLSLPALPLNLHGRLRELRELQLVVEGKSEFFDEHGRYVPMRIFTNTINLVGTHSPALIPSRDPNRPSESGISLAIPFDVRLPGWLPPTHVSSMTNTAYGARAMATVGWVRSDTLSAPTNLLTPLSELQGRRFKSLRLSAPPAPLSARTVQAPKAPTRQFESFFNSSMLETSICRSSGSYASIDVRRFQHPNSITPNASPTERHYSLRAKASSASPVEFIVSVPEWVDPNGPERSLRVSLRIRARCPPEPKSSTIADEHALRTGEDTRMQEDSDEVGEAPCPVAVEFDQPVETSTVGSQPSSEILVHLLELGMEVEESERYSSVPSQTFTSAFPLPSAQPSRHSSENQLISPRSPYADALRLATDDRAVKVVRVRPCLLADDGSQRHFVFADEGLGLGDRWRKVNVMLPMRAESATRCQPAMDGPFIRIKHALKIRVVCRTSHGAPETTVVLTTPIRFGTCPSTCPPRGPESAQMERVDLPAYVQLFQENGEMRECDPVPLYMPPRPSLPPITVPSTFNYSSGPQAQLPAGQGPAQALPRGPASPNARALETPRTPTPSYDSLFPEFAHAAILCPSPASFPSADREQSHGHENDNDNDTADDNDDSMDIDSFNTEETTEAEPQSEPTETEPASPSVRRKCRRSEGGGAHTPRAVVSTAV